MVLFIGRENGLFGYIRSLRDAIEVLSISTEEEKDLSGWSRGCVPRDSTYTRWATIIPTFMYVYVCMYVCMHSYYMSNMKDKKWGFLALEPCTYPGSTHDTNLLE